MTEATGHSRYGVYRAGSDLIEVSGSSKDHTALLHWLHDQSSPPPPPEAHLRSYLSCIHEKTHRDDFTTTSFGLLMWRIDFTVTTDTRSLIQWFGRPPAGVPLLRHVETTSLGAPHSPKEAKAHEYVYKVAGELARLLKFRALIWAGDASKGVTLAELVDDANTVLGILRDRFGLTSTWMFTTAQPDAPATVSIPYVTSYGLKTEMQAFGGREVSERHAAVWERLALLLPDIAGESTSIQDRWPESVGLWSDWRLVKTLHPDLGDLNNFDNMLLRERLAVYALSGWCDPAIHRINDVFIEDALPAMRWRAALEQSDGGEVIVIPEISDQTTLYRALEPLYRRLARATLNGDDGVFADHKVDEELYALRSNPHVSYTAYILRQFRDKFWLRAESRILRAPSHPLMTLFDDDCNIWRTAKRNNPQILDSEWETLYVDLFYEYVEQQLANHDIGREALDVEYLRERMWPMADLLCGHFPERTGTSVPDTLTDWAIGRYVHLSHRRRPRT